MQSDSMPRKTRGKRGVSEGAGADAGAVETKNAHGDPDLQAVVTAWPDLPDEVKADIVAMVKGAGVEG